MSRLSFLTCGLLLALIALPGSLGAAVTGGHLDPTKVTRQCTPCHRGHGVPKTPMLITGGDDSCLECHRASAQKGSRKAVLGMTSAANPAAIKTEIGKAVVHRGARCVDCHSVHGLPETPRNRDRVLALGSVRPSTKRGFDIEASLCLSCHGTRGPRREDPHDLAQLLDPTNPSFHPVLASSVAERVPSLKRPLTRDSMINCTDCHTNDDPSGPRGPHGSRVSGLLGAAYSRTEGQPESASSYALCYSCHERQVVLENDPFPLHQLHIVDEMTPCSICHNPHGATRARALIRFNEPTSQTNVNPSTSGRLAFVSDSAGSGACFLQCHGKNHDPLGYGFGFDQSGLPTATRRLVETEVLDGDFEVFPTPESVEDQRLPPAGSRKPKKPQRDDRPPP